MQKTIVIDVSPVVRSLWNRYNGELTKKQWLRKKETKNKVIEYIKSHLIKHDFYTIDKAMFKFISHDALIQDVLITIVWDEKENINVWTHKIKEDYEKICKTFCGQFIVSMKI